MAQLDLTTFTTATDGHGGTISVGASRLFFSQIERDESTYCYATAATLGYSNFDSDFTVHFSFVAETMANGSIVYPWGVATDVNNLNTVDTNNGSYLAVLLNPNSTTNCRVYLSYCRAGTAGAPSLVYAVPSSRSRYTPIYAKVIWDANGGANATGQLSLTLYNDPAETIVLAGPTTLDVAAGAAITGLDTFYAFSSYDSGSNGYDMDGWTGNFYIDESPPATFTITSSHILANWDQTDTMEDFLTGWTESIPAGTTCEEANFPGTAVQCAHLVDDGADAFPVAYIATTVNVWEAQLVGCTFYLDAMATSHYCPIVGVTNDTTVPLDTTAIGMYAMIASDATAAPNTKYYLRIANYTGVGWDYTTSAVDKTGTTWDNSIPWANQISLDTEYDIVLGSSIDYTGVIWAYLYCRDVTNGGNWRCVDSKMIEDDLAGQDWTANRICIGQQGTLAAVAGDIYIKDVMYHDGAAFTPALARGGSGDTRILLTYERMEQHGGSTPGAAEWMYSDDNGATWTDAGSWGLNGCNHPVIWDAINSQWILNIFEGTLTYQTDWYTLANADLTGGATDVSDHAALFGANKAGLFYPSRMIESGYLLSGNGVNNSYQSFAKVKISDGTVTTCPIARLTDRTDITATYVSETFIWRRSSDDNLMALVRWDDNVAPILWFTYYQCIDTVGVAGEGTNYQTGTCDSNQLNKIVDTSENFGASNGSQRLRAVQAGYTVRNTTDTSKAPGYVKAVSTTTNPNDTLEIMDSTGADYDICPNGTENYEICCWGKMQYPAPTEEYINRGGLLCAFAHKGYLYMQGYDQDSYQGSLGPMVTWVAKVDDADMSIIQERIFQMAGARTPTADRLEPGNGDLDAANQSGSHTLDACFAQGIGMFYRLDAVDQLSAVLGKINGQSTASLKWNGQTSYKWEGFPVA